MISFHSVGMWGSSNDISPRRLSITIFCFAVIVSFYSFGNFGFLNLFDARRVVQFIILIYSFFGMTSIFSKRLLRDGRVIFLVIFFVYYGVFLSIALSRIDTLLVVYLMLLIALFLLFIEYQYAIFISKAVVLISFMFSIMGAVAFFVYLMYPENLQYANTTGYTSDTGADYVEAGYVLDYFSFVTPSDRINLFGLMVPRMKGFSTEPSSAIVHYLAPVALAFLLGGKYRFLGYFMLAFFAFCILTLTGVLLVLTACGIYVLFMVKNKPFIYVSVVIGVGVMLNILAMPEKSVELSEEYGNAVADVASFSLAAGKTGSVIARTLSYKNAILEIYSNPLGGSKGNTMTGLVFQLGLVGGVLLMIMYLAVALRIFGLSVDKYKKNKASRSSRLGSALIASIIIFTTFISSYGWDQVSGVIVLALFYRLLLGDRIKFFQRNEYSQRYSFV